jgi:hypothetical protein
MLEILVHLTIKIDYHCMNEVKIIETSIDPIQFDVQDGPTSPFSPFKRIN